VTQSLEGKGGGGGQGRLDDVEEAANDAEGENSGNNNTTSYQEALPHTEHSQHRVVKGLPEDPQRLKSLWTAKTLSRQGDGFVKKNCC
jgi:hypothetical protein